MHAQSAELFQTWYVYQQNLDGGDPIEFTPDVSRSITIQSDLSYTGQDECITYSGNLEYIDGTGNSFDLVVSNFNLNTMDCADNDPNQSYQYIDNNQDYSGEIYDSMQGLTLAINEGLGFGTLYTNQLLNVEEFSLPEISIYPNPVGDRLKIVSKSSKVTSITISDFKGKVVLKSTNTKSILVDSLPAGIYFVRLKTAIHTVFKKIIKQ